MNTFFNLLLDATSTPQEPTTFWGKYGTFIMLGVVVVIFFVWMTFSNKKNKERQQEYTEGLAALAPGHKVKTIGGICGIVKEVCEDNTVIVQTGSEQSGYSTFKIDKECIAQSDAKGPTQIAREQAEANRAAEKAAKKQGVAEEGKEETPAVEETETPEE